MKIGRTAVPPAEPASNAPVVRYSVSLSLKFFPQLLSLILILSRCLLFHRLANKPPPTPSCAFPVANIWTRAVPPSTQRSGVEGAGGRFLSLTALLFSPSPVFGEGVGG